MHWVQRVNHRLITSSFCKHEVCWNLTTIPIKTIMEETDFVPETMSIMSALKQMRKDKIMEMGQFDHLLAEWHSDCEQPGRGQHPLSVVVRSSV